MRRWMIAVAVGAVALGGSAQAGIGQGNGEIGLDLGYASLDDAYGDDGTRVIARGGYFFTDLFQLELQSGGAFTNCSNEFCTDLDVWMLDAVFNFQRERWVPYVLVGAGYADRPSTNLTIGPITFDDPGGSGSAYQAAVGARRFFGGRTAIRLEASVLSEDTFDDTQTHVNATIGVSWRLGAAH